MFDTDGMWDDGYYFILAILLNFSQNPRTAEWYLLQGCKHFHEMLKNNEAFQVDSPKVAQTQVQAFNRLFFLIDQIMNASLNPEGNVCIRQMLKIDFVPFLLQTAAKLLSTHGALLSSCT